MSHRPAALRAATIAVVAFAGLSLAGCSAVESVIGSTASEGEGTNTDVFSIKVGSCINDADITGSVSTVPTVDCATPHDSEVYHTVTMTDVEFPGTSAIEKKAQEDCSAAFATFIGLDFDSSALQISYLYPTTQSWDAGDREITCVVYDPNGQTTGSLAGAAR